MTQTEAAKVINNYRDFDEDTGEEYGYVIMAYKGTDASGNHLFECRAEGEDEITTGYPVYAVTDDKQLVAIPT